jgi:phospholipid-binding lipoprotein MlaA
LKFIDEAALDPYVFTRESFLQWRNNLATDGKSESSLDLDDELVEDGADSATKSGDTAADNKTAPAQHVSSENKYTRQEHELQLLPPSPSKIGSE